MTSRETEYQDPEAAGSLSRALQLWLGLLGEGLPAAPYRLVFTLCCPSESRAQRVAGFLRRRLGCETTGVKQVVGTARDGWHVVGATQPEVQSLRSLERFSLWLRRAATSHQVHLIHVGVVDAAAA